MKASTGAQRCSNITPSSSQFFRQFAGLALNLVIWSLGQAAQACNVPTPTQSMAMQQSGLGSCKYHIH